MRWFVGIVVALLVGTAIYVGSAVVSLRGLIEAARAGDGAGVLARTDTARVRRSLVDQIVSAYLTRLGRDRPVKTLERLAANTYGASIADAMIAQMLTEENLANILNTGAIRSSGNTVANIPRLIDIDTSNVIDTLRRIADSGDCGQGFRLNATMHSDRRRPPIPTKAAGVSLPA
jgi:hypothetical protein